MRRKLRCQREADERSAGCDWDVKCGRGREAEARGNLACRPRTKAFTRSRSDKDHAEIGGAGTRSLQAILCGKQTEARDGIVIGSIAALFNAAGLQNPLGISADQGCKFLVGNAARRQVRTECAQVSHQLAFAETYAATLRRV